jgi:large subunit ribosomal protein L9e
MVVVCSGARLVCYCESSLIEILCCACTVKVDFKARVVTVSGPKGKLTRSFKHIDVDIQPVSATELKVDLWFGNRKTIAAIRTICSHIENMITGVTKGFRYKMRFCYAHFPINVTSTKDGVRDIVEIRNFLGEKKVRKVSLMDGVKYSRTADVKDQIEISGIDVNAVSLSCAQIAQSTAVKHKDIRKFLDGIYVSEKGHIEA